MTFTPQSQTNLTVLMIAGALFASVGLWLMLRPKKAEDSAKIELFGLKFESSSAGLLVFIVGSAFLAVPLFADLQSDREISRGEGRDSDPAENASSDEVSSGSQGLSPEVILPPLPDVDEVEPNDTFRQANQLELGTTVAGVADGNDHFVVPLTGLGPNDEVTATVLSEDGRNLMGDIRDQQYGDRRLGNFNLITGTETETFRKGQNEFIFIRLHAGGRYELTVR